MNLWCLKDNQCASIGEFDNDISPKYQLRFLELGFQKGERIRCIQSTPFNGSKVFEISNSVFSVSEVEASKILVHVL
jgi:Fe2+ transport system protein FeoA